MIEFMVTGIPKGQPRPKAFARKMPGGNYMARVYDPGTAEAWKTLIAVAAKDHIPKEPIDGPIDLFLMFLMPRPKAHFTKKGLRDSAPNFHFSKPDSDNLAKAVMDTLGLLRFWKDDAQVCELVIRKRYAGSAGCIVRLGPAGGTYNVA